MDSDMTDTFKAAIIQHAPVFLNLEESLDKAGSLIEKAADQGAKVIAFPETWLPGYPVWLDYSPKAGLWDYQPAKSLYRLLVDNSVTLPGKHLDQLLSIAQKTGAYVVMGAHERVGGTLYNTTIYVGIDGKEYKLHRKLVPTYTERLIWGRGDGSTLSVLMTDYGVLGGLICWEHWMPLARAAMHARYETLHVAQWPAVKDIHQIASRHYAFEGRCFVLAAGSVLTRRDIIEGFNSLARADSDALELLKAISGEDSDLILNGGSAIIAPNGEYLAGPVFNEPSIIYAEIDPALISEGHLTLDTSGHYSRPDIFRLEINDQPQHDVTFRSGH
uniref:Nitrilase n=1 Tax=uncultured organism TaxID=155900 RepID=Q6RWR3_9ZZZZ|nr:nitrilase [uncultured organism]